MVNVNANEKQRRGFADGNCAIGNPMVTREGVDEEAEKMAKDREAGLDFTELAARVVNPLREAGRKSAAEARLVFEKGVLNFEKEMDALEHRIVLNVGAAIDLDRATELAAILEKLPPGAKTARAVRALREVITKRIKALGSEGG